MTTTQTRQIEFIAALSVPQEALPQMKRIRSAFEESVKHVLASHPAVVAYLVQDMESLGEVHIGFRFADVDPAYVEDWAEDLLAEAFEYFKKTSRLGSAANLKREDSSLQIA